MAKIEQRECDRCRARTDESNNLAGGWGTLRWDEWARSGQEPREADLCPECTAKMLVIMKNKDDTFWWGTTRAESKVIHDVLVAAQGTGVKVPQNVIDMLRGAR